MTEIEAFARDIAELSAERDIVICLLAGGFTLGDFEKLAWLVKDLNPEMRLGWCMWLDARSEAASAEASALDSRGEVQNDHVR
ncbi:MAG: hypothetical protein QM722_15035 [Piscinibacter sp.]